MKQIRNIALSVLLFVPLAAPAQWNQRDQRRAERADRIAERLSNRADRVWNNIRDRRLNRTDEPVDLHRALRNFADNARNFAADLLRSNPQDYRPAAQQLITEAEAVGRLVERTETTYRLSNQWSSVEAELDRLANFYNLPYSPSRNLARRDPNYRDRDDDPYWDDRRDYRYDNNYGSGVFRWRGRVDGVDYVYLRGSRVDIRHAEAQPIVGATHDLSSPLPRADLKVQLRHLHGRGVIQLIQQPSNENNFTAGVMIRDDEGGADDYEFELRW